MFRFRKGMEFVSINDLGKVVIWTLEKIENGKYYFDLQTEDGGKDMVCPCPILKRSWVMKELEAKRLHLFREKGR